MKALCRSSSSGGLTKGQLELIVEVHLPSSSSRSSSSKDHLLPSSSSSPSTAWLTDRLLRLLLAHLQMGSVVMVEGGSVDEGPYLPAKGTEEYLGSVP